MKYGDSWSKEVMPDELEKTLGNMIDGYYKWRLKTSGTGCAHIFFSRIDSQKELEENWRKVVDNVAVCVQSEVSNMLDRSNFYIWFFVADDVKKDLIKEIEDNTYSSRKFVVSMKQDICVEDKLDLVKKKLFSFDFVVPKSDNPMVTGVEFLNFRVYKGKRSFDFSCGGKTARLVVLFAPNGMGKTSFFDGIEWGLSGAVGRFTGIADKNTLGLPVLKNTDAGDSESYVKIFQEGNGWIKRRVSELNKHTLKDYGTGSATCSQGNPLEEYLYDKKNDKKTGVWSNLILPHHKIDGFIAGMKPTALYKEWGSIWDAKGENRRQFEESYNRKRKESGQYEEIKENCDELRKQYEELKKSRNFVQGLERDVRHFLDISGNTVITELDFSTVSASEYIQWSNLVDGQYDLYEKNAQEVERKCDYLNREIGHDIEIYCTLLIEKKDNVREQKRVKNYLERCLVKNQLLGQKKEQKEELEKLERELEEARFLYEKGEEWYLDAARYFDADIRIEELKKMLDELENRISVLQDEGNKLAIVLEQKEKERREEEAYRRVCEHAGELAQLKEKQETLAVQKADCERQVSDIQKKIIERERIREELDKNRIEDFESVKGKYGKDAVNLEEDAELRHSFGMLIRQMEEYRGLEDKLSLVIRQILAEEQVEERIKNILTESRRVIEEHNLSYCPVCNTEFHDSQELLQHTYKVVSKEGAERKKEKENLEAVMSEVRNHAEKTIDEYNTRLNTLTGTLQEEREQLCRQLSEKKKGIEKIQEETGMLSERMAEIQRKDQEDGIFVVYQEDGIRNWRSLWNAKLDEEVTRLKTDIQKNEVQKTAYQTQLADCRKTLDDVNDLVIRMEAQQPESYTIMREAERIIRPRTYSTLKEWIDNQADEYEDLKKKIVVYNEQLEKLQDVSISLEGDYEKQDMQIHQRVEKTEKDLAVVRRRIEDALVVEIPSESEATADYLNSMAEARGQVCAEEKEHIGMCMEALRKLKYNREVENYFLRWEEVSLQLKKLEEQIAEGERRLEDAEEDYRQQKEKIEGKMGDFLKKYRMGEIYEKLEPHEELKHLVVEFFFDEKDQPGLSFGVAGEEGKTYPPAWFLSTAQLNVVAFAIFLGRALQKEDVPLKSIFIDDPIGHFDEMNIVGFVDLLRNILENTDRQLIISTHEERVFGLIKRKMPEESYSVRYIDFREMTL